MRKNFRLTIDFEVDIDEKIRIPGEDMDKGEYPPEILEKAQHIMDAFFQEPGVMTEFVKMRFFSLVLSDVETRYEMAELLGVREEKEFMSLLASHLPRETVPYLLGVFCRDKNFTFDEDEEEMLYSLILSQFEEFRLSWGSLKEKGKPGSSIIPGEVSCPGDCLLARLLRDFFIKEVKYAR